MSSGENVKVFEETSGCTRGGRRGRGQEKVLLWSKCNAVRIKHMGWSDLFVTMRMTRPRLRPEGRQDWTPAVTCPHLRALLHHKEKIHTLCQLSWRVSKSRVIEYQQEEEGPEWWVMKWSYQYSMGMALMIHSSTGSYVRQSRLPDKLSMMMLRKVSWPLLWGAVCWNSSWDSRGSLREVPRRNCMRSK